MCYVNTKREVTAFLFVLLLMEKSHLWQPKLLINHISDMYCTYVGGAESRSNIMKVVKQENQVVMDKYFKQSGR